MPISPAQGSRLAQIHYAFQQKGISVSCQKCQHNQQWIYEGSIPVFLLNEEGVLLSQHLPAIIFLCQNCGHITSHSSAMFPL